MAISLKAARVNSNLTQEEAAKKLGVSKSALQKWESGECFPSTRYIPKITEVYKIKYDDIYFLPSNYA